MSSASMVSLELLMLKRRQEKKMHVEKGVVGVSSANFVQKNSSHKNKKKKKGAYFVCEIPDHFACQCPNYLAL